MRLPAALAVLLAVFLALGAVYAAKTPYRQAGTLKYQGGASVPDIGAPDERQHANYVRYVLDGKGFPVLKPGSPDLGETYQSHQPPLYYVLAAGWSKLTGADPTDPNSGRRVRYLNLLIGFGTLLGVFYAARWGLDREDVALAAVAFAGLMPMFVALHAALSNDPLLFFFCTWTVALCALALRKGWSPRTALLCGLCVGLGLLTKTTALALLPTVGVALLASFRSAPNRPGLAAWALALVLPLVVGAPWMARNQSLYGDPFAISAFNEAFVGSPQPHHVAIPALLESEDATYWTAVETALKEEPDLSGRALLDRVHDEVGMTGAAKTEYWTNWVAWWTSRSYVGAFGYMDIFLLDGVSQTASDTVYRVILLLFAALGLAWVLSLRGELDGPAKSLHLVNAVLLAVVAVLFVRFNLQYFQGQARYLYPAVVALSIGLGGGLCHALGRKKEWAWAAAGALLLVVQALALASMTGGFETRTA